MNDIIEFISFLGNTLKNIYISNTIFNITHNDRLVVVYIMANITVLRQNISREIALDVA